jgi:hypothetical protein
MPRTKVAAKKGKIQAKEKTGPQTETKTGGPQVPKTQEQLIDELVARIRENVEKGEKFIQVSETFKKVGPGLTLTGLQRVYKQPEKSDFIYTREFRFAGSTRVVDQLLGKLGSSVAGQRLKNDIVDTTNYQDHLVVLPVKPRVAPVDLLITHDKMSELVKRVKENRTAVKEDKGTPKKKRAQRRKSHTGVKITVVSVETLVSTVSGVAEVIRQLVERQLGLDVTNVTFEESPSGLVVKGARSYRNGPKTKRVSVEYAGGHVSAETSEALETFLRRIGHTDTEVKTVVDSYTAASSKPVVKEVKKAEPKTEVKVDAKKDKTKKSELRGSPKVTKAKTRTVKPRTSNE